MESSGQALRLRPDDAAAYDNICAAENAMGSYAAAAAACERALALQPDLTLARNNLAVALSKGRTLTSAQVFVVPVAKNHVSDPCAYE